MSPPVEVCDLAYRLGALAASDADMVRLRQSGRMRQAAGGRWMPFRAGQNISLRACAFSWIARTGPAGLLRMRDALVQGQGELSVTAFGLIRIAGRRGGAELTRGELMRYLAELAWAPDAILLNQAVGWRVEAADRMVAFAGEGAERAEVTLQLNGEGRIASAFAPDRPRALGDGFVPMPWRGQFSDWRRIGGRWLPTRGAVGWEAQGEPPVSWEGRIEAWRISPG
jgi:hypothetical protein